MSEKKKYQSTSRKLLILILILPAAIFLATTIMTGLIYYQQGFSAEQDRLRLISETAVLRIDAYLQEQGQLVRTVSRLEPVTAMLPLISRLDEFDQSTELETQSEAITRARRIIGNLADAGGVDMLYIGSETATGLFSESPIALPPGYDARERPWYVTTAGTRSLYVTDPYLTAEEGRENEQVISVAYPIMEGGTLRGVAALDTGFGRIAEIAQEVGAASNVSLTIFSLRNDQIVWSPERENWGVPLNALAASLGYPDDDIPNLLQNIRENPVYYFEGDATQVVGDAMIQTNRVPSVPEWGLFVIADKQIITARTLNAIIRPLLLATVIFIGALAVGFLIAVRTILRPLNTVSASLADIAGGDGDLTVSVAVQSRDDIRRLADNFNAFVSKIHDVVVNVKIAARDETGLSQELTASITETNAAMHEIATNIESIGRQVSRLDESVESSASSAEEITQNIRSMIEQIGNQAAMVEETGAAITQMMSSIDNVATITERKSASIENLNAAAERGKAYLEETNRSFKEGVAGQMNEIQQMTHEIESIAAQTNLLSMNAAIEAAHAGEAGRGFAVVAEEIRKLADGAGQSSKHIAQTLKAIMAAIDETGEKAETTAQEFDLISTEVRGALDAFHEINATTQELTTGAREITKAVSELGGVTTSITTGSDEIQDGTRSMLERQTTLREVSAEVSGGIQEIVTGSSEIHKAMQALSEENNRLQQAVETLNQEVGRFRTD